MTQEDKELLRKDLCARLAYGVMCKTNNTDKPHRLKGIIKHQKLWWFEFDGFRGLECKPYLRSMSSMTEEEIDKYHSYCKYAGDDTPEGYDIWLDTCESYDYLNSIHVDYRDLIPNGLAIEVTK